MKSIIFTHIYILYLYNIVKRDTNRSSLEWRAFLTANLKCDMCDGMLW